MRQNTTVLSQLLSFVPRKEFNGLVGQHKSDYRSRQMSTWQQFVIMLFAQASGSEGLRDIEGILRSQSCKLSGLGIDSVARSTLSDANKRRNPEVFEALFHKVLKRVRSSLPAQQFTFENDLYALDGSLVTLVQSLFDWALYRSTKGGIRLHTVYCMTEQIPVWMNITNGKKHEQTIAREHWKSWNLAPGSILTFDRGYVDFAWWAELTDAGIFWVSRAKSNTHFFPLKSYESDHPQLVSDTNGHLVLSEEKYPNSVRQIEWLDPKTEKVLVFLTNNFELAPEQIAEAYKARWQIEIFFKWIKQHLKIKSFFGTSYNAIATQIWVALIYFLILTYIKAKAKLRQSAFLLSKIFAQALLQPIHIIELFRLPPKKVTSLLSDRASPQLILFS